MSQPKDTEEGNSPVPELLHPGSRTLFRYWERVRGERSAPGRLDIDLKSISAVLPAVGILERHSLPTTFRWRIAGTSIGQIWGADVTGRDFLEGWKGIERQSLLPVLNGVVDALQPFVARIKITSDHGEMIGVEFLALPVRSEAADAVQILCAALCFRDAPWLATRVPRRLELASIRTIWTEPLPGDPLTNRRAPASSGRTTDKPLRVINGGKQH